MLTMRTMRTMRIERRPSPPRTGLVLAMVLGALHLHPGLAAAEGGRAESGRSIMLGDPAPALAVQDLAGKSVALADFRGETLVVQFFATWCAPCHRAWVDLQTVLAEGAAEGGGGGASGGGATGGGCCTRVLMVSLREPRETVEAHARASGMTAPKLPTATPSNTTVALDGDGRAAARWGADRLPTIFIVDGSGIVRHINRGWGPGYRARLRHWLAGRR